MLFLMFVAFWLAGFHGAHHSNVPINQLDSGSGADPFDEAEFELLDGEMMIEQFLAGSEHNIYTIHHEKLRSGICMTYTTT